MQNEKLKGLLPTPTARDEKNPSSPDGKRIQRKVEQGYTIELNDLASMGLLPTPRANSAMGTALDTDFNHEPDRCRNLETVIGKALLPTPRTSLYKVEGTDLNNPNIASRSKGNLEEEVAKMVCGLLPTPTCNDSTNASIPPSQGKRNDSIVKRIVNGEIPTDYSPNTDGTPFRLSPLFTEEMMGFPFLWTTLPFLKRDGDLNPSKPTGTQ